MSVTAKPGDRTTPEPEEAAAPDAQIADLRRRLRAAEARLAAETAAREEQEKLARSMARAARSEAAEGEALARDAAELRSLLEARQDEHAAAMRELARRQEEFRTLVDAEVTKRLSPELERRLAEARTLWDENRKRERARLAETSKHEAEQRVAAAEAAWREEHNRTLEAAAKAQNDEHKRQLAAARKEWEQEHDAAIADRDRRWRERLDREVRETRAAMEKIWARAQDPESDDAASVGLRGMRHKLNAAAHRRRIVGYRVAILMLSLALAAAFAFRYPSLEAALTAAAHPDRAVSADRQPATPAPAAPQPGLKTLRLPIAPARDPAKAPAPPDPKAMARVRTLEAELSTMRKRLEAEEKRANDAEYESARLRAARKKASARTERAFRAQSRIQAKAVADLEDEIRELRRKLDAARAATAFGQSAE